MKWIQITLLTVLLSFTFTQENVFSDVPDKSVLDSFLREAVKRYRIPGLAVAVVNDKEVLYASGFGESSPGIKITSETPFLLGSTTKSFTALAIMRLVENGKVGFEDPITIILPVLSCGPAQFPHFYRDSGCISFLLHCSSVP